MLHTNNPMTTKPLSLRPDKQEKTILVFDLVNMILNGMEKFRTDENKPLYDLDTIQSVRRNLTILEGWEGTYLDGAFRKGVDVGMNPDRPDGLCNPNVYSYSNDFFKKEI